MDTRISIGPQTRVHVTHPTHSQRFTRRKAARRVHTYDAASQHDTAFVEILLDLRSFSATTDALSLAHSRARLTPTECEREASCERAPIERLHYRLSTERKPTDDDDGEAALHFLALPWAGPVEGSARGAWSLLVHGRSPLPPCRPPPSLLVAIAPGP